jgi:hypothetical protein
MTPISAMSLTFTENFYVSQQPAKISAISLKHFHHGTNMCYSEYRKKISKIAPASPIQSHEFGHPKRHFRIRASAFWLTDGMTALPPRSMSVLAHISHGHSVPSALIGSFSKIAVHVTGDN